MKLAYSNPSMPTTIWPSSAIQALLAGDERQMSDPDHNSRTMRKASGMKSGWDGVERRQQSRRQAPRRRQRADVLLDTRARQDRRSDGRRSGDRPQLRGFTFKA